MKATSIKQAINNKENVTKIYLDNNQLKNLPKELLKMPKLEVLKMYCSNLVEIPKWIGQLNSLKSFYLHSRSNSQSQIKNIPVLPPNLEDLTLHGLDLNEFPREIIKLKKLKALSLSSNQIPSLDKDIGDLQELEFLQLHHNKISEIPESVKNLKKLNRFLANNNELTSIPSFLGDFPELSVVHLANNNIQKIPTFLNKVESLVLENNHISEIPSEIKNLQNIKHLNLDGNQITSLSSDIKKICPLFKLSLKNNQLGNLPDDFFETKIAERIDLSHNQLTELPSSLYRHYFWFLDISCNQFTDLPITAIVSPIEEFEASDLYFDEEFLKKRFNFAKACYNQKIELEVAKSFYYITIQKSENLNNYPLEYFFKALTISFAPLQEIALKYLRKDWKSQLASKPLQKGSSVVILGKTGFKKKELKERLEKVGVILETKISKNTSHVILEKGIKKYENFDREGLIFIPETALQEFLDEADTLYLNEKETPEEEIENIHALLMSEEEGMVGVGIEMLASLGVPKSLITELFLVVKNTRFSTKVRNKAKKMLLLHCSEQLKINLNTYKTHAIVSNRQGNDFVKNIKNLIKDTELDTNKIVHYVERHLGQYNRHLGILLTDPEENFQYMKKYYQDDSHSSKIVTSDFVEVKNIFRLAKDTIFYLTINKISTKSKL